MNPSEGEGKLFRLKMAVISLSNYHGLVPLLTKVISLFQA